MKQTNNAIKFLMAQYRAIFQNAYFKGLATAAVVTMGLAAGQAQAADTDFEVTDLDGLTAPVIITGDNETGDGNKWKNINLSLTATKNFASDLTISGGELSANKITCLLYTSDAADD